MTPIPSSAAVRRRRPGSRSTVSVNVAPWPGVADRVLGEVLGHDPEHPRTEREVDRRVPVGAHRDPGPGRARRELVDDLARAPGARSCGPSETTSVPLSSSERKRISSISSPAFCTSARACSRSAGTSASGRSAESSRTRMRASGVRSSWETEAVNPARSSSNDTSSTIASARRDGDRQLFAWHGLARLRLFLRNGVFTRSSPFRHRPPTVHGTMVGAVGKILIVEDDNVIADGMARHLTAAGLDPVVVGRGELGLARLRFENPDVCVLDLMLPELDGWKLIETARSEGIGTPIVVVSARGTEHDRVHALEIGADDYLVKPFSMRELVARVVAAARRGVRPAEERRGEAIDIEELKIDPREVQAYVGGVNAGLTPTEFKLLYTLALDRGRVVTRDELLQKVWGRRETHRDRTVDVFVRRLRQKVDRIAPTHTFIHTRFGVGYKLEPEPK